MFGAPHTHTVTFSTTWVENKFYLIQRYGFFTALKIKNLRTDCYSLIHTPILTKIFNTITVVTREKNNSIHVKKVFNLIDTLCYYSLRLICKSSKNQGCRVCNDLAIIVYDFLRCWTSAQWCLLKPASSFSNNIVNHFLHHILFIHSIDWFTKKTLQLIKKWLLLNLGCVQSLHEPWLHYQDRTNHISNLIF